MKKYIRWIGFGLIAVVLIVLLLLVGLNRELRNKIKVLLTEQFIKNKVKDFEEDAAVAKSKAKSGKLEAKKAEKIAKEAEDKIKVQKEELEKKLNDQGLSADEISNRFNSLRL